MRRGGEHAHVGAGFGEQHLCGAGGDPGDGAQQFDEFAQAGVDDGLIEAGVEGDDAGIERIDMCE